MPRFSSYVLCSHSQLQSRYLGHFMCAREWSSMRILTADILTNCTTKGQPVRSTCNPVTGKRCLEVRRCHRQHSSPPDRDPARGVDCGRAPAACSPYRIQALTLTSYLLCIQRYKQKWWYSLKHDAVAKVRGKLYAVWLTTSGGCLCLLSYISFCSNLGPLLWLKYAGHALAGWNSSDVRHDMRAKCVSFELKHCFLRLRNQQVHRTRAL